MAADVKTDEAYRRLVEIETAVLAGEEIQDVSDAKAKLRRWLLDEAEAPEEATSIADAIALLAKSPQRHATAAIVLLRALDVRDLVPSPNPSNSLARYTVELCEGAIPFLCDFLGTPEKKLNHEKFDRLTAAHQRIGEILKPISTPYKTLQSLINARKGITGSLHHGAVRKYGEPFRLPEVRGVIDAVLSRAAKVSSLEPTLLLDVDDCRRAIQDGRSLAADETFLTRDYLRPFLDSADAGLQDFLTSIRGRFATEISRGAAAGTALQKRYPLHEPDRELRILVPMRNSGPGMATDVRVTVVTDSNEVMFHTENIYVGNVLPGEFSVTLDALVVEATKGFSTLLQIDWSELGNPIQKSQTFQIEVKAQATNVDWGALQYWAPYSTNVAEGDAFIGRSERLNLLASKMLRRPMEPFFITGQKRVGKTSLALAASELAKEKETEGHLDYHYILWGTIAHEDPRASVRDLGESIESFMVSGISRDRDLPKGSYEGTLAPLVKLAEAIYKIDPLRKFVVIIDEFDEIHQELFLQGSLAETFFANLRALTATKNVCLVLVGGENMPYIMNRQGQKLNKLSRINLSYFSRESEWSDYQDLVRLPTDNVINWHDDAIVEVFNATNGNPYFTKIICGRVLSHAVAGRDADVSSAEVKQSIETEVASLDSNFFAHLWQDGIFKPMAEREPDIVRRSRVLIAIARCFQKGEKADLQNISEKRGAALLGEAEIPAVLNDFTRREVLREVDGGYDVTLPLFRLWLVDIGIARLVTDSLSEELAIAAQAQEDASYVRSDEIAGLTRAWPTYRGKHVGSDEVRAWLQQVDSNRDQRILFKVLQNTRLLSEVEVREKLRSAHSIVRSELPEFVARKLSDRRQDVMITYIDGEGKSGQYYAAQYAEENKISHLCVYSAEDFTRKYEAHLREMGPVSAVVVVDDIAATGRSLSENASEFVTGNPTIFNEEGPPLLLVTLLSTGEADVRIRRKLRGFDYPKVNFRAGEILTSAAFAFDDRATIWSDKDEFERAKALAMDLGARIYRQRPLGFGGMGLLIIFPTTVPNNTLPILHSYAKAGDKRWVPLFPRIVN